MLEQVGSFMKGGCFSNLRQYNWSRELVYFRSKGKEIKSLFR